MPRKKQKEGMPRRGSIEGKDKTLFQPNCIFCKRYVRIGIKKQNVWTSEGLTNFEREGGPTIIKIAEKIGDEELLTRIRGEDLFAKVAKYHTTCRMRYSVPKNGKVTIFDQSSIKVKRRKSMLFVLLNFVK